jgi:hypothetical protein
MIVDPIMTLAASTAPATPSAPTKPTIRVLDHPDNVFRKAFLSAMKSLEMRANYSDVPGLGSAPSASELDAVRQTLLEWRTSILTHFKEYTSTSGLDGRISPDSEFQDIAAYFDCAKQLEMSIGLTSSTLPTLADLALYDLTLPLLDAIDGNYKVITMIGDVGVLGAGNSFIATFSETQRMFQGAVKMSLNPDFINDVTEMKLTRTAGDDAYREWLTYSAVYELSITRANIWDRLNLPMEQFPRIPEPFYSRYPALPYVIDNYRLQVQARNTTLVLESIFGEHNPDDDAKQTLIKPSDALSAELNQAKLFLYDDGTIQHLAPYISPGAPLSAKDEKDIVDGESSNGLGPLESLIALAPPPATDDLTKVRNYLLYKIAESKLHFALQNLLSGGLPAAEVASISTALKIRAENYYQQLKSYPFASNSALDRVANLLRSSNIQKQGMMRKTERVTELVEESNDIADYKIDSVLLNEELNLNALLDWHEKDIAANDLGLEMSLIRVSSQNDYEKARIQFTNIVASDIKTEEQIRKDSGASAITPPNFIRPNQSLDLEALHSWLSSGVVGLSDVIAPMDGVHKWMGEGALKKDNIFAPVPGFDDHVQSKIRSRLAEDIVVGHLLGFDIDVVGTPTVRDLMQSAGSRPDIPVVAHIPIVKYFNYAKYLGPKPLPENTPEFKQYRQFLMIYEFSNYPLLAFDPQFIKARKQSWLTMDKSSRETIWYDLFDTLDDSDNANNLYSKLRTYNVDTVPAAFPIHDQYLTQLDDLMVHQYEELAHATPLPPSSGGSTGFLVTFYNGLKRRWNGDTDDGATGMRKLQWMAIYSKLLNSKLRSAGALGPAAIRFSEKFDTPTMASESLSYANDIIMGPIMGYDRTFTYFGVSSIIFLSMVRATFRLRQVSMKVGEAVNLFRRWLGFEPVAAQGALVSSAISDYEVSQLVPIFGANLKYLNMAGGAAVTYWLGKSVLDANNANRQYEDFSDMSQAQVATHDGDPDDKNANIFGYRENLVAAAQKDDLTLKGYFYNPMGAVILVAGALGFSYGRKLLERRTLSEADALAYKLGMQSNGGSNPGQFDFGEDAMEHSVIASERDLADQWGRQQVNSPRMSNAETDSLAARRLNAQIQDLLRNGPHATATRPAMTPDQIAAAIKKLQLAAATPATSTAYGNFFVQDALQDVSAGAVERFINGVKQKLTSRERLAQVARVTQLPKIMSLRLRLAKNTLERLIQKNVREWTVRTAAHLTDFRVMQLPPGTWFPDALWRQLKSFEHEYQRGGLTRTQMEQINHAYGQLMSEVSDSPRFLWVDNEATLARNRRDLVARAFYERVWAQVVDNLNKGAKFDSENHIVYKPRFFDDAGRMIERRIESLYPDDETMMMVSIRGRKMRLTDWTVERSIYKNPNGTVISGPASADGVEASDVHEVIVSDSLAYDLRADGTMINFRRVTPYQMHPEWADMGYGWNRVLPVSRRLQGPPNGPQYPLITDETPKNALPAPEQKGNQPW